MFPASVNDSNFWDLTPLNLELHEMEFAIQIKKRTKTKKPIETAYEFKVTLIRNNNIYRKIKINPKLNLYGLAEAIIYSFDFDLDHCFGFYSEYVDGRLYDSIEQYELFVDLPDVEASPKAKSIKTTKIQDVWTREGKMMYFLFDYGDGWMFEVEHVGTDNKLKTNSRRYFKVSESKGKSPEQYPPCE